LFGSKSQIAQMVAAYKAQDSLTQVYCIGVVDGTTAATGSITWSGTATEAGALVMYIAGRRVSVSVDERRHGRAQLETAASPRSRWRPICRSRAWETPVRR
jgi:phage tail sheath gpL-like